MIELKNINIEYPNKKCIINGNFKACFGNIIGIHGESGTGKSSLLYLISMLSNQRCEYYIDNHKVNYNKEEKENFRNNYISFITQDSLVIESLSVANNIDFYLMQVKSEYTRDEILKLLDLQNKKDLYPNTLSGGERQRLAIGCAIAKDTKIIIGDEITSCNDSVNKELIISLLKKCAKNGKIVIIVTHDDDVLSECDVIYKIDDCHLILESKEIKEKIEFSNKERNSNINQIFELLLLSNKKINFMRIVVSFLVLICLFAIPGLFIQNQNQDNSLENTIDNISDREILILNDPQRIYQSNILIRPSYGGGNLGIDDNISQRISNLKHIDKIYDYYTFENRYLSSTGYWNDEMNIVVKRNGSIIDKKEFDEEDQSQGYTYDFTVKPFFKEQERFQNGFDGVYINENIAYVYNIQKGDLLEINISVPFASVQSLHETGNSINNNTSKTQEYLAQTVKVVVSVLDVIASNLSNQDNEIFMYYDDMMDIIDNQISRYNNNDIKVNVESFQGFSTIEKLTSPVKICFVDKKENVLYVKDEIEKIDDNLVVGYDYLDIQKMNDAIDNNNTFTLLVILGLTVISFFVAIIIEILFLLRYETLFKVLRLNGYSRKSSNKFLLFHGISQFMIMVLIAFIIYLVVSIPDIIVFLDPINGTKFRMHLSDFLFKIYIYCRFTWKHFLILISLLISNTVIVHYMMNLFFNKKDITLWIRGK